MTHRYRIVHHTRFTYSNPVSASQNEVRMTPRNDFGQTALESRLRVRPLAWSNTYRDYWGTHVTAIEATGAHGELDLESVSTVERSDVPYPGRGLTWDELRDPAVEDRLSEWLHPRPRTSLPEEVLAMVSAQVEGLNPSQAVQRVLEITSEGLAYQAGATQVHSDAADAWAAHLGVCQDYSHVVLGMLRHLGIPARYVSGYLTPEQEMAVGESSVGESHAWVEWWDGAWVGVDPTNLRPVGLGHVVVAQGRDYDDVPPIKGMFSGSAEDHLSVEVSITRLA